jgi:putative hemolysin
MLFQLKTNERKDKQNQQTSSKIDKFWSMISKVKFFARNVVFVKKRLEINKSSLYYKKHLNSKHISPRNFDFSIGSFSIKIINEPHPLMLKAKELRQKSFFGSSTGNSSDTDEFDKACDHLIVVDNSVSKDFVVGTYRLLFKPEFVKYQKFYSQSEFDISNLLKKEPMALLEAGRSCVHKDYRDGRIIKLLWRGLATYILNNRVKLIFGCASFPSSKFYLFRNQLSYLHHYHRTPKKISTSPVDNLKANFKIVEKKLINDEEEFRNLPPLIKAYIRAGAWIGPGAIVDKKFDTTDVLIVLDARKILKKYTQLSFKEVH